MRVNSARAAAMMFGHWFPPHAWPLSRWTRYIFRAGPRGGVYRGALQAKDLNRAAQAVRGESMRGAVMEAHWRGFPGSSPGNF